MGARGLRSVDACTLCARMQARLLEELPNFRPMELSSTAWALAKFDPPPAELQQLMAALHGRLLQAAADGDDGKGGKGGKGKGKEGKGKGMGKGGDRPLLEQLSPQGVANCLWAFARAEPPPPAALLQGLLSHVVSSAAGLTPQGVANACSACARLDGGMHVPLELLGRRGAVESLSPVDLAESCWALGKLLLPTGARQAMPTDAGRVTTASAGWALTGNAGGVAARPSASAVMGVVLALLGRAADEWFRFDWQASSHVELLLRSATAALPKLAGASTALRGGLGTLTERLVPLLDAAVWRSIDRVQRDRCTLDQAAAHALLNQQLVWGASLPRGAEVLLVGGGSVTGIVRDALVAAGLVPRMWHRFASAQLDAASTTPPPPSNTTRGYAAVLMRLPPTRSAFEMALHAVAQHMVSGTPLVVFGTRTEGIQAVPSRLPSELFTLVATKGIDGRGSNGGSSSGSATVSSKASNTSAGSGDDGGASSFGAIAHATRTTHPATAAIDAWEVSEVLDLSDGGEPASPLPWCTLPGLFAGGKLDVMTAVLLRALPPVPSTVREHECSSHLCCCL